jgi:hypothetical protein
MGKKHEKLQAACFKLARNTMWEMKPVDADRIKAHAQRLYEIALERVDETEGLHVTIPLVTRAIDYLRQTHALPPLKENTEWFQSMLDALLEVARPNVRLEGNGRLFLKDLQQGIKESLSEE